MTDPTVSWWEVFDMRGQMLDSADRAIEEANGVEYPCMKGVDLDWEEE